MVSEPIHTRVGKELQPVPEQRFDWDDAGEFAVEWERPEPQRATVLIFRTKKFTRTPDTEDFMMLAEEALEGEW
jgi:hypothetical protein